MMPRPKIGRIEKARRFVSNKGVHKGKRPQKSAIVSTVLILLSLFYLHVPLWLFYVPLLDCPYIFEQDFFSGKGDAKNRCHPQGRCFRFLQGK